MANKDSHVGARVTPLVASQMDLIKDIKGLSTIGDLVRLYIEEGLARDNVNIEEQIERRLAAERERLETLFRGATKAEAETDPEENMFSPDEDEPVTGSPANVPGPADNSDLVPTV